MTTEAEETSLKEFSPVSAAEQPEDKTVEEKLRPRSLDDFIGQEKIKIILKRATEAAEQRGEGLRHVLFIAPAGTGKTLLARLLRNFEGAEVNVAAESSPTRVSQAIADKLWSAPKFLHLEEVHGLSRRAQEIFYSLLDEAVFNPIDHSTALGADKNLTIIGTTTDLGKLGTPFVTRFPLKLRLAAYSIPNMVQIIQTSSQRLNMELEPNAAFQLAVRARATPRIANRLLRHVRDWGDSVSEEQTLTAMEELGIDKNGLDEFDRKYLEVLRDRHGVASVSVLAASLDEAVSTLENVYEPYLIKSGFISKSSAGRMLLKIP